jgi:hypothetical protein
MQNVRMVMGTYKILFTKQKLLDVVAAEHSIIKIVLTALGNAALSIAWVNKKG